MTDKCCPRTVRNKLNSASLRLGKISLRATRTNSFTIMILEKPELHLPSTAGHFKVNVPDIKSLDFKSPPSFIIPLKRRTAPEGYECYMTCAVKGDPTPHVTWYRNNISLNTDTNYHVTNVCGVCSLRILKVGPHDDGEYKVVVENQLGTAESSMILNIRGINIWTKFKNHIFLM